MIAALFVEKDGVYYGRDDVDPWDEERDARLYPGPWPVVAHPPCARWTRLGVANYARWGGEHNRPGNDQGCFASALASVKKYGGVLEHPAASMAWEKFGLAKPRRGVWTPTHLGWTCCVWQSAYGHKANKATWLYVSSRTRPFDLDWRRPKGSHQIGFYDQRGKSSNKPTLSKRQAAATPPAFAEVLIRLAIESVLGGNEIMDKK